MIRRNTWIALVIFAVLLAATLYWQQTRGSRVEQPEEDTSQESSVVFDVGGAQVVGVTVQGSAGKTLRLVKDSESNWRMTVPVENAAENSAVETAITQLLGSTTSTYLSSTTPLEDLGLAVPDKYIVLDLEDGRQVIINIGKITPTGSGYYVLTSDRKIVVVSTYSLDTVFKLLENPPIQPTPTPEVVPEITPTP